MDEPGHTGKAKVWKMNRKLLTILLALFAVLLVFSAAGAEKPGPRV